MNKIITYLIISVFVLTGCSSEKEFNIGITPMGIPITLLISNSGVPSLRFTPSLGLKFFTVSLGDNYVAKPDYIYVELIDTRSKRKHIWELVEDGSKFFSETNGKTKVTVFKKKYSTIVKIESEEINNYLYTGPEPDKKPRFPEHPWVNFTVTKWLNSNIDWKIENIEDFFADILFGFFWIFTVLIDFLIILISFFLRIIYWLIILIIYAVGLI